MRGDCDSTEGGLGQGPATAEDPEAALLLAVVRKNLADVVTSTAIGRFEVAEMIGSGGMGVVYRARDHELQRDVALKVVHSRNAGEQARLKREAQALARLSHPNVVTVYDTGSQHGQLWIAMELVRGPTLRQWLREQSRPAHEIRARFVQAAQGLAAAHHRGIVHRDFKPANVLLTPDGTAKVVDFGLAVGRLEQVHTGEGSGENEGWSAEDALEQTLTRTGTLLGTPAFMAPEQARGERCDAASDQYSYCVALYEALYERRPLPRDSCDEFLLAAAQGSIDWSDGPQAVSARDKAVLRRGMAYAPAQRFASMDALLDASTRRASPTRVAVVALGLGSAGVVAAYASFAPAEVEDARACTGGPQALSQVWSVEHRARVREAFAATRVSYAEQTADKVAARLDAFGKDWVSAYQQTCEAASPAPAPAEDQPLETRMACLRGRLALLEDLIEIFEHIEASSVANAVTAVAGLPAPRGCENPPVFLDVGIAVHSERAAEAEEVWQAIERAHSLQRSGAYPQALAVAQTATTAAQSLGLQSLIALAAVRRANLEDLTANITEAEASYKAAYFASTATDERRPAVMAALGLVHVIGLRQGRYEEAQTWARHARAELQRVPNSQEYEAILLHKLAGIADAQGNLDEALAMHQRAMETFEVVHGEDAAELAVSHLKLGSIYRRLARLPEAKRETESALRLWRSTLGDAHPYIGSGLTVLGTIEYELGDFAASVEHHRKAVAVIEASAGDRDPNLAVALSNLSNSLGRVGDYDAAIAAAQRALMIWESVYDEAHPARPSMVFNIGVAQQLAGRIEQAEASYRRALGLLETMGDAAREDIGMVSANLSLALLYRGEADEALVVADRSVAAWGAAVGDDHPDVTVAILARAEVLDALGRHDDALQACAAAVARLAKIYADDNVDLALARTQYAQALLHAGQLPQAAETIAAAVRVLGVDARAPGDAGLAHLVSAEVFEATGDAGAAGLALALARADFEATGGWTVRLGPRVQALTERLP